MLSRGHFTHSPLLKLNKYMPKKELLKPLGAQPEGITHIYLSAIIVPNGEIICLGKTIGKYKELKKYLFTKE